MASFLERQQALRIATCYLRLDRLSRYETTHLNSSSGPYRLGEFFEGVSKLDARASSALSTALRAYDHLVAKRSKEDPADAERPASGDEDLRDRKSVV